ncbi:hypothetical protein MLD38_007413 [Melastoma candidum]|uniref:Uncharacterized protein n=1 Tax=Melastoma candidum TaxID=119954 RepID=A0ACB9RUT0_9MYRT|nr:hypothetical protein MLD38_007413 [Melastoma candidum]
MTIFPDHHDLSTDQARRRRRPRIFLAKGGRGGGYSGYSLGEDCYHGIDSGLMMVDPSMAKEESRASGCNKTSEEAPPSVSASGSKGFRGPDEDEDDDKGWLQLSIGGGTGRDRKGRNKGGDGQDRSVLATRGLVELDLLPTGRGSSSSINTLGTTSSPRMPPTMGLAIATPSPPLLFQLQHGSGGIPIEFPHPDPEMINWGFRPVRQGKQGVTGGGAVAGMSSILSYPSSSSSSLPHASPYFRRPPFQLQTGGVLERAAGPSTDVIKIMDPSQRRHSGIWFMLLASKNQDRESHLPQIPKSYLRIKDGKMTVRLLTKYLVNKLNFDSESEEVEITCRGQELQHDFTLQHVRDNIWSPWKDYPSSSSSATIATTTASASTPFTTLLPDTSTIPHLMVLHYSRRRRIAKTSAPTISLT